MRGRASAGSAQGAIPPFIRLDFAYGTRAVLIAMGSVMTAAAVVALLGLRGGVQADEPTEQAAVTMDSVEG